MLAITIDRQTGHGKYADVLDAADELARGDYGSATNAIAVMVRQSDLYREAIAKLNSAKDAVIGTGTQQ